MKKIVRSTYNKMYENLKGSGLSKYQSVLKIHRFFTKQLRSDYVMVMGYKLYLDKNDEGNYSSGEIYKRHYLDLLEKHVSAGDSVVDIGAKIGVYSLALSKFVGPTGFVFAFEPSPDSFMLLKKNQEENQLSNLIVEQKAVVDKSGIELLEIMPFSGNNRISNNSKGMPVNCVSFDDYFKGKKISFIKIDVEGSEPRVLAGMKNFLQINKNIKILLEYNPKLISFYGYKPEKLLTDLIEYGFELYDLEHDYDMAVNVEHFQKKYDNTNKLTNIFAIRNPTS